MAGFVPRRWQSECFSLFECAVLEDGEASFVLEACPGAGKSAMAAWMTDTILNDERFQDRLDVEHVIAVVPFVSIQGSLEGPDAPSGMCKAFHARGLRVRDYFLNPSNRVAQPEPLAFDASIITYQALNPDVFKAIRLWRERIGRWRFALILDEVHHTRISGGDWGPAAEQLSAEAAFTVCMSGTYFRSDGHPINLLRYEDGKPFANYRYTYRDGLIDRCVRPVAFRRFDQTFDIHDNKTGEDVICGLKLSQVDTKEQIAAAQRKVFDAAKSSCIEDMIREAHADLMRKRKRFPDAGCLVVCRPGGTGDNGEDRYVEQIASAVQSITGITPIVLTHHDGEEITRDKLARFRSGTDPYLVAVNMVSEGCDIPRLRSLVFCRYTESEMMFRQIVGRVMRVMPGDDDTAADVYLPHFPVMDAFANNIVSEHIQAAKELACKQCGNYPCMCSCLRCGATRPDCVCERNTLFPNEAPSPPRFEAVNLVSERSGGVISGDTVEEFFVQEAGELVATDPSFAHSSKVQLGRAMQFCMSRSAAKVTTPSAPPPAQPGEKNVHRRIVAAVRRLADIFHPEIKDKSERYSHGFNVHFEAVYGVKWSVAKVQWSPRRVEEVCGELERRVSEERYKRRNG